MIVLNVIKLLFYKQSNITKKEYSCQYQLLINHLFKVDN